MMTETHEKTPPPELTGNEARILAEFTGQPEANRRTDGAQVISPETIAAVKNAFPQYAETLGARPNGANRWLMSCPLPDHADARPSFAIFQSSGGGFLGKCSCGWTGDAVKLARALNPGLSFPAAVEHVAEAAGIEVERVADTPGNRRRRIAAKAAAGNAPLPTPPTLPPGFEARHRAARSRLYGSPRLLEAAAAELGNGITARVVQSLTYTSDALGWADGKLLYLYEHGAKARNPPGVEPRFRWLLGRAALPWRWHFAAREEVKEVYLTESESDAVALIAAGAENLFPKNGAPASAVVAIPGSNNFAPGWAKLFRGKRATLVFDWDGKSDAARDKTARLLAKQAGHVKTLNSPF